MDRKELAKYIDHTILNADATNSNIVKLCEEAMNNSFASVCVNANHIEMAAGILKDSNIAPCCVIAFPLGASTPLIKANEARSVIELGATEIDMVINIAAVKDKNWTLVKNDIESVAKVVTKGNARLKVIIETCILTNEEKIMVCKIARDAGADFVKTSTGFSTDGATVEDVELMRKTVGAEMGVKASGGIRDYETAIAMINAGATRIGTSSGLKIIGIDC